MKYICYILLCAFSAQSLLADQIESLIPKAKLVFEDDFNREEKNESQEELGKSWKTNSTKRANGVKQADLDQGTLKITMAKGADHGVSVLHDAPFDDGMVRLRFKMLTKRGMSFNFNDPSARKIAHAGHVCSVNVTTTKVQLNDQITGIFERNFYEKKKAGKIEKAAREAFLKDKVAKFKVKLETNQWYELGILILKDEMQVFIDGKLIGALKSSGLDHKVKQNIAFAVSTQSVVDDLKVWSLDK